MGNLMSDVWCEGGALIDRDARRLGFFVRGNRCPASLRRHLLPLMAHTWPGWEIRWAEQGLVDIATAVGIDPDTVRDRNRDGDPDFPYFEPAELLPATDDWESVLTIGRGPAAVDYRFEEGTTNLLALGPPLLDRLRDYPRSALPPEGTLFDGVYLDPERQAVWVWSSGSMDNRFVRRIAEFWPGWEVHRHDEGLRRHVALSGRDPAPFALDLDTALERIVTLLGEGLDFDPAALLQQLQAREGAAGLQPGLGFLQAPRPADHAESKAAILARALAAFRAEQARRPLP